MNAEVVKLVNTLRSGRSARKGLRVQIPLSAHFSSGVVPNLVTNEP